MITGIGECREFEVVGGRNIWRAVLMLTDMGVGVGVGGVMGFDEVIGKGQSWAHRRVVSLLIWALVRVQASHLVLSQRDQKGQGR